MTIWVLVKREIAHRKLGFATGLLSLTVATTSLVAGLTLLHLHDLATEQTLLETERELRSEMTQMEDRYRRIMRDMGHNVMILNRDQDMAKLRSTGHPDTYLDDEDVWKLAHGNLTTLNHLLPVLQEKFFWQEQSREIILTGIRGQVPVFTKPEFLTEDNQYRSPIVPRVPDGQADLGAMVAIDHELRPGDTISIGGHPFTVRRIYAVRGNIDDMTVWIPLDKAQEILGRGGKINGIFALECVCDMDELGKIHQEVEAILPHAKVFEFTSLIAPRAAVRRRGGETHRKVVQSMMAQRHSMRGNLERLAAIVVPLLSVGAGLWIFALVFGNLRERRYEIGVFRAVGYSRSTVMQIFLGKALLMGMAGGVCGCVLGVWIALGWSGAGVPLSRWSQMLDGQVVMAGLLLSPLLSLAAAFIPAMLAAKLDPAAILREE